MAAVDRADAAAAIPTIVAQETLTALTRYSNVAAMVNRDFDEQVASYGEAVRIAEPGAVTAQNKVAETPITWQGPAMTGTTVTLDQHKVVPIMIEDVARALSRPDLLTAYGEKAAIALAESVEDAILGLATDAAITQQVGSAGGTPGRNTVLDARGILNTQKAPRNGRYLVLSPDAETGLLKDTTYANALVSATNDGLPNLSGFEVAVNQGVTVTAGTPNRTNNIAFQRDAIVLATRPLTAPPVGTGASSAIVSQNGVTIRVISSYSHDNLALKLSLDILFGVKILRAAHIVRLAS